MQISNTMLDEQITWAHENEFLIAEIVDAMTILHWPPVKCDQEDVKVSGQRRTLVLTACSLTNDIKTEVSSDFIDSISLRLT